MEVLEFKQAEAYQAIIVFTNDTMLALHKLDGIDIESDPESIQVVTKSGDLHIYPKRNIYSFSIGPEETDGTND